MNFLDSRECDDATTTYHVILHQSLEQYSINTLNIFLAKQMYIPIKSHKTEPHISSDQVFPPKKLAKNPFDFWKLLDSELGMKDCRPGFSFHIHKNTSSFVFTFSFNVKKCEHFPVINFFDVLFYVYVILHPTEKSFIYLAISLIFGITYCFLFWFAYYCK